MIAKTFTRLIKLAFGWTRIAASMNWAEVFRLYDRNAEIVVLMSPRKLAHFRFENFVFDCGHIQALVSRKKKFAIRFSFSDLNGRTIFWRPYFGFDPWGFPNYAKTLVHIAEQLESHQNLLVPSSREVLFLENKGFMYREFQRLGVSHPKTLLLGPADPLDDLPVRFPVLVKLDHSSGSVGMEKLDSVADLEAYVVRSRHFTHNETLIVQELLPMRRDFRVEIVGDDVVLYYWRINPAPEWRSTATRYGSSIRFADFPERWRDAMIDTLKKLGLRMGAFDIAWANDDLATTPYYLEVSPMFSPNPPVDLEGRSYDYGRYKKLLLKDSFDVKHVDVVFDICQSIVDTTLCLGD